MRVLVTGGAGFIGSHVSELALADGHDVHVIDNLSRGKRENVPDGAEFHEMDLCRDDTIEFIKKLCPERVLHHAAQVSVPRSLEKPEEDLRINVSASLRLF
ncbi:MAG TPA: NAD-dependent epimerase/dehydratase family protein, partial [bacterium]|nr:NAD-dependent epimerase/dehydratase family protein [bacterium]